MTVLTPPPTAPPSYPAPPPAPYQPPYVGPPGPPVPSGPYTGRPSNRNRWIIGIIAVVVALVAAIAAIVIVNNGGGGGGDGKNKPAAPTGVHLVSVTSTTATIAWSPAAGTVPTRYAIYRNGAQVDTVPGAIERTTDTGLTPQTTYRYDVTAYQNGSWSDHSVATAVTTKSASLADAALNDNYDVNLRVLKEYGYTHISPGDTDAESWWFKTKADGSVVLFGEVSGGSWKMHLSQTGNTTYTGVAHETLSQCNITPVNTALSVKLHVLKGGLVNGAWAATQFNGTYKQTAPYTVSGLFTCPGAGYTASVAGHIVR
jgi:chitodextrinase